MTCLISFDKFSDVLSAFTWASATSILWSICLELDVLKLKWLETLATQANILGIPFPLIVLFLASNAIEE